MTASGIRISDWSSDGCSADLSKGFKGGGFDPRGAGTSAPAADPVAGPTYEEIYTFLAFDPEKVDSYEIGYKGSLLDRRLTLGLAGFYMNYKDVQITSSEIGGAHV